MYEDGHPPFRKTSVSSSDRPKSWQADLVALGSDAHRAISHTRMVERDLLGLGWNSIRELCRSSSEIGNGQFKSCSACLTTAAP